MTLKKRKKLNMLTISKAHLKVMSLCIYSPKCFRKFIQRVPKVENVKTYFSLFTLTLHYY